MSGATFRWSYSWLIEQDRDYTRTTSIHTGLLPGVQQRQHAILLSHLHGHGFRPTVDCAAAKI